MYWIVVSAMTIAAMGFLLWPLTRGAPLKNRRSPLLWSLALFVPLLALGVERVFLLDDQTDTFARSLDLESIDWSRSLAMVREIPDEPDTSVAPVSALIDGLEARLAQEPEDAKGWALLAQSYAFVDDEQQTEAAIVRAVNLGFDEADLRHRVELAFRSSREPRQYAPQTWVDLAIGG